jgi:hypothetical protein
MSDWVLGGLPALSITGLTLMTLMVIGVPGAAAGGVACAGLAAGLGAAGGLHVVRTRRPLWQAAAAARARIPFGAWCYHCKAWTEHELATGCTECGRR